MVSHGIPKGPTFAPTLATTHLPIVGIVIASHVGFVSASCHTVHFTGDLSHVEGVASPFDIAPHPLGPQMASHSLQG